jgi:hypothetical protein
MNSSDRDVVEALAAYIADLGDIKFGWMNEFLKARGVDLSGDEFLTGEHIRQPHVHEGTTLYGPVSAQYVEMVEALFKWWPVRLMIGDPADFAGDEPWWIS